jgi:hypothetical protein
VPSEASLLSFIRDPSPTVSSLKRRQGARRWGGTFARHLTVYRCSAHWQINIQLQISDRYNHIWAPSAHIAKISSSREAIRELGNVKPAPHAWLVNVILAAPSFRAKAQQIFLLQPRESQLAQ